jgi:hypothetical protein
MKFMSRDVVVQTTGRTHPSLSLSLAQPPIKERKPLSTDLWIGPLSHNIEAVMSACEARGLNFNPIRQYGHHYCFVRERFSDHFPSLEWDEDQELQRLLLLSRLVHPTTASNHYSARLIYQDGDLKQIIPGPTQGIGAHAWVARDDWRDWLSVEELELITSLLPTFVLAEMPVRVRRAMHHFHFAQFSFSLDQRVASVVTAFESMLKIGKVGLTEQFKARVTQLAEEFHITIIDREAEQFYDDRSGYLHGASHGWVAREESSMALYERMEELLRKILVRTVADRSFAEVFATDLKINTRYPWARRVRRWRRL